VGDNLPLGNVIVNISPVANDVANKLMIDAEHLPVTLVLTVDVAAVLCGIDVDVLTRKTLNNKETSCTVNSMSSDVLTVVQSYYQ